MNPMSLLTLPNHLIAVASSERAASTHCERRERKLALAFVVLIFLGLTAVVVMR